MRCFILTYIIVLCSLAYLYMACICLFFIPSPMQPINLGSLIYFRCQFGPTTLLGYDILQHKTEYVHFNKTTFPHSKPTLEIVWLTSLTKISHWRRNIVNASVQHKAPCLYLLNQKTIQQRDCKNILEIPHNWRWSNQKE